ncbi:MAG: 50S ribosomal protein L30e [Candidatus Aenigmatarchaeota archaeon]|nr:MAG: 50S ribosomal protein L30e [Candidatus Aenigmarchaeota archaeon]
MTVNKEIKEAMEEEKLIIGTKSVMKNIKRKDVKYVICSSNCTEEVIKDLNYYSKNFAVEIKKFKGNSRQLGEICGKPFNVMLLGIKK